MKRTLKAASIFAVISIMLLLPSDANANVADMLVTLKVITSALRTDIALVLVTIRTARSTVANLEQGVVWPVRSLNLARSTVLNLRAQYIGLANRIYLIPLNSATLPASLQFESVIRGGQIGSYGQISANYTQVFQPLPTTNNARAKDRNLIDADDATALAALKMAVAADQSNQSTLSVANALEQQAGATAPGAAPLLLAQAQATDLQSAATLHHLLAAELREEAGNLAHRTTLRRRQVEANTGLRLQLQQVLTR